jgi:hypothetical protein
MYFPTNDHYYFGDSYNKIDKIYNNENNENNECFICLEIVENYNKVCIKLHNTFYSKSCSCDGWIHEYCLHIWYIQNKKCPICLCIMNTKTKTNTNHEDNDVIEYINPYNIYNIFNMNNFYSLLKFSLLFCFIYNMIHFFIIIWNAL